MKILSCTIFMFFLMSCGAWAGDDAHAAASRLADVARDSEVVRFYFISKTGNYSFSSERMRREATVVIDRRCGANCHNFMSDIIFHLGDATEKVCAEGQESLLVEVGSGHEIIYSHFGREVRFEGRCYLNENSINTLIKDTRFLFK